MTATAQLNLVEKVIALESVELLGGLSPEQLSRIATIANEIRMPPKTVVLDPTRRPDSLYVIIDGTVDISQHGEIIHTAGTNDVLGAWALFDDEPMPVKATTADDCRLLRIVREDFYDLLSDNMEITAAVFSTLVKRFRKLVGQ